MDTSQKSLQPSPAVVPVMGVDFADRFPDAGSVAASQTAAEPADAPTLRVSAFALPARLAGLGRWWQNRVIDRILGVAVIGTVALALTTVWWSVLSTTPDAAIVQASLGVHP